MLNVRVKEEIGLSKDKKWRILLIDDDETLNGVLTYLLNQAGYEVESVLEAKKGLRILQEKEIDLVLTDIVMPDMDGIETIIHIRKMNKQIPLIAMSGGGKIDPEDYGKLAIRLGADDFFKKPFDQKDLISKIQTLLEKS